MDTPPEDPTNSAEERRSPAFPATRWSIVLNVQGTNEGESRTAMAELCNMYWYPLYAYVRRSGYSPQDAEDLTQSFFHGLIQRETFAKISPDGGRLRSYLLKAMNHFMSTDARDKGRQKRGGGKVVVSIDQALAENRLDVEPRVTDDPCLLFERQWATVIMENVLSMVETECRDKGKSEHFKVFKPMLMPGGDEVPHREIAEQLGVSEGAARVALFRIRQRYGEILRSYIADTVSREEDIADEISHLMNVFKLAAS